MYKLTNVMKPKRIKSGATIGIFTPSEPLTQKRLGRMEQGVEILRKNGYFVKFSENYLAHKYYMAGSIEERVEDIHRLVEDDTIDMLMISWGGKSCCQLLPYLDYELIRRKRKPISGFSDGGVLLNAILAKSKLITFYGPNVVGKLEATDYSNLSPLSQSGYNKGSELLKAHTSFTPFAGGVAEGVLVGGNLSTFVNAISGTEYEPEFGDWILFWESGSKTSQELDYLIHNLRLIKSASNLKGILIGDCDIKNDNKWGNRKLSEIVLSVFRGMDIPILFAPIFGHKKLSNPIFPIGCRVCLNCINGTLTLLESPFEEGKDD